MDNLWLYILLGILAVLVVGAAYVYRRKVGRRTRGSLPVVAFDAPMPKTKTPRPAIETSPQAFGFVEKLQVDDWEVDPRSYRRPQPVNFGDGDDYTACEGVVTFRGNNFRDSASYGRPSLPKNASRALTGT